MKRIKTIFENIWQFLFIGLISVVPFWKTGSSGIINKTDADFPLMPSENLRSQLFVWYDKVTMGYDISAAFLSQLPFYSFVALMEKFGISVAMIERIWFVLGLFVAGIAAYLLAYHLSKNKLSSVIASTFYLYNPVTLHLLSQGEHIAIICYAFIPLFLLFSIKGVEKKDYRYAIYIGLISIIAAVTNVPTLAVYISPCFLYLVYALFSEKRSRLFVLKFSILTISLLGIFNAWWFIPGLTSLSGNTQISTVWLETWKIISGYATYYDTLLASGITARIVGSYQALAVLVFGMLALALFAVFKTDSRRLKNALIFSFVLFAISYAFAIGYKGRWGENQRYVMEQIPQLQMFRNPYKFAALTIVSYTMLLSIGLSWFIRNFQTKLPKFIICIATTGLIAWSAYPALSGDLDGKMKPVYIPSEYYKVNEIINPVDANYGILILPQQKWLSTYSWTTYDMPDFSRYIFRNPIIRDYPENRLADERAVNLMTTLYEMLRDDPGKKFDDALYLMNAKYLLLHKDIVSPTGIPLSVDKVRERLGTYDSISLIESNQYFDLYKNTKVADKVYTSSHAVYNETPITANTGLNTVGIYQAFAETNPNKSPVFFFNVNRNLEVSKNFSSLKGIAPKIEFFKNSPVDYSVKVSGADSPYFINLQESFSFKWQAEIDNTAISQEGNHFVGNGYGNSWYIDKKGDYEIHIYYSAQKRFIKLAYLAISALALSAAYLLLRPRKISKPC